MAEPVLVLKPGREKSLLRRHPWVFSGAVAKLQGDPELGETVGVYDSHGNFMAWAAYSPASQIRLRVWSWERDETISFEFFQRRLRQAIAARNFISESGISNAVRLVHAESDGLPGLILDRYEDTLVMQILSAGAEFWRETLADLAMELTGGLRVYERSDIDARKLEGLETRNGILRGDEPPPRLLIYEKSGENLPSLQFWVDVRGGQKTGFYLDQRDNRLRVSRYARECEVLDCFSFTGGFAVSLMAGGAKSIHLVDSSGDALGLARENLVLNGFPLQHASFEEGDVFYVLRALRDKGQKYDLIVLDPPKFAPTASHAERAARGYKDINLLAFKMLRPGGILATFSCSGGVSEDLFQKIVSGAALDAGVEAQILERLHQSADHPVSLSFPEGAYLKGFVIRIN